MIELRFPAMSFTAGGVIAPGNIPPAVAATLEKACAEATARPEYKAIAARLNVEARHLPGAAFRKLFDVDLLDNADAVKRMGPAGEIATEPAIIRKSRMPHPFEAVQLTTTIPRRRCIGFGRTRVAPCGVLFQAIVALLAGGVLATTITLNAATAPDESVVASRCDEIDVPARAAAADRQPAAGRSRAASCSSIRRSRRRAKPPASPAICRSSAGRSTDQKSRNDSGKLTVAPLAAADRHGDTSARRRSAGTGAIRRSRRKRSRRSRPARCR